MGSETLAECSQSLRRVWLFVTLWTVARQAPMSLGFSKQEYWSGLPFPSPGDLPNWLLLLTNINIIFDVGRKFAWDYSVVYWLEVTPKHSAYCNEKVLLKIPIWLFHSLSMAFKALWSQGQRVYRDWGIYLLAECWAFTTETGVSKDHFLVKWRPEKHCSLTWGSVGKYKKV